MALAPLAYEEIKRNLIKRLGHQWPVGARLPSAPALARELGAGQRNTARAMQELAREGYLHSRRRRGTFVAVAPSSLGRPRPSGGFGEARLVIFAQANPDRFMTDIIEACMDTLASVGEKASVRPLPHPCDLSLDPYRALDGMVILNPDVRRVRFNSSQCVVFVSSSNRALVDATGGYDIVGVEQEQGAFMAGRLLRNAGCKHVCFLGVRDRDSHIVNPVSATRLSGFEEGWGDTIPPDHQLWGTSYMPQSGSVAMAQYLALYPQPQGVFAASDDLAMGFIMGGLGLGLIPGRDYQLVGFDGQQAGREMAEVPPLTSIAIPSAEMGRRAAQLLLQRLEHPEKPVERVMLGCTVFHGGTVTRCVR